MRDIKIGDNTVRLRGSSLSLIYYQQAFNRDLVGDLAGMVSSMVGLDALKGAAINQSELIGKINFAALDTVAFLRLIWVLARTAVGPTGQFPSFERWIEENEDIDIFDGDLLNAAIEEASKAFFRPKQGVAPSAQR